MATKVPAASVPAPAQMAVRRIRKPVISARNPLVVRDRPGRSRDPSIGIAATLAAVSEAAAGSAASLQASLQEQRLGAATRGGWAAAGPDGEERDRVSSRDGPDAALREAQALRAHHAAIARMLRERSRNSPDLSIQAAMAARVSSPRMSQETRPGDLAVMGRERTPVQGLLSQAATLIGVRGRESAPGRGPLALADPSRDGGRDSGARLSSSALGGLSKGPAPTGRDMSPALLQAYGARSGKGR